MTETKPKAIELLITDAHGTPMLQCPVRQDNAGLLRHAVMSSTAALEAVPTLGHDAPLFSEGSTHMSKINDGGQAFPVPCAPDSQGGLNWAMPGMSLRDWFAGQALAGTLATYGDQRALAALQKECPDPGDACGRIANACYAFADAMLAEREKEAS